MKLYENFKNTNYIKKKKTRFILSFIGTILYGMAGITSMGISHYSVYITSYFHHKQIDIDMQYGNLIMPILMLSNSLFSPLAGLIEKKCGLYLTLIISSLLLELDLILFINQTSVLYSFLLIIFLGFSNGIGMAVPGKNLYFYYPKKGGFLGSLIGSCFILLGTITGVLGENIINPEKYTLQKGEQFYPLEISQNYIKYFKYLIFINPILLILSLLLIKKYSPELDEEFSQENNNIENLKDKNIKKDENYSKNIKSALRDKRIWRITGINIFTPFVMGFSGNTFRVYGALASISGAIMQYSVLFNGFSNIFVGPLWGYINDKYKYEIINLLLCGCSTFHALILTIFIKSNTIYIICIFLGSIIMSGFMSASRLHILRVYGIKYSLEIGGIIGIFGGIFNIVKALLSFIISKYYHTGEELQFAYRFIYMFGIGICGFGFFLALYEKEDKFIYPYSQNESDYSSLINSDFSAKNKYLKNNKQKDIELELELENNSLTKTLDSDD